MDTNERHIYRIFTAQHILKNYLVKSLRENDVRITPAHSTVLFLLENGEGLTLSELSGALFLDNSTVTGLIERLENVGLIQRSGTPDDRRKCIISISPQGLEEIKNAKTVINRVNKEIEQGFTKSEIRILHRVLESFEQKFLERRNGPGDQEGGKQS